MFLKAFFLSATMCPRLPPPEQYLLIQHASSDAVRMLIGTNCHRENKRMVSTERASQVQCSHVYLN